MSAWLVSKTHIDALVTAAQRAGLCALSNLAADACGRMLWRENMLSLGARYGDAVDESALAGYRHAPAFMSDAVTVKACHCFDYQSCEHAAWEASEAFALICGVVSYGLRRLNMTAEQFEASAAYKAAPWGIDDSDVLRLAGGTEVSLETVAGERPIRLSTPVRVF